VQDLPTLRKTVAELRGGKPIDSAAAEDEYEALRTYGIDLVEIARRGKLDPGRCCGGPPRQASVWR
jgi:ATP-dependent Clp protease ATP-binding subunit ClpB